MYPDDLNMGDQDEIDVQVEETVFALDKTNGKNGPIGKMFEVRNTSENTELLKRPLPPNKTKMTCRNCKNFMMTKVKQRNSLAVYFFGFLLCFVGAGTCCCCFIPCCMNSCKITQHSCSRCNTYLGEYVPR